MAEWKDVLYQYLIRWKKIYQVLGQSPQIENIDYIVRVVSQFIHDPRNMQTVFFSISSQDQERGVYYSRKKTI